VGVPEVSERYQKLWLSAQTFDRLFSKIINEQAPLMQIMGTIYMAVRCLPGQIPHVKTTIDEEAQA